MKYHLDCALVVEGRTDVAFLSSFLDCEMIITEGSAVPRETLDYILELSKTKEIVVLTDPDYPGKRIRDLINSHIPNLSQAFVPKDKAIKKGKVGVAETDKDTVINAIRNKITPVLSTNTNISTADLLDLRLVGKPDSASIRNKLCNKLHLGFCNGKTLAIRLNSIGIDKEQLKKVVEEL